MVYVRLESLTYIHRVISQRGRPSFSTFTPEDRQARLGRGLSSLVDAVDVAIRAQVKRLALFHYDQDYSDDTIDALVERGRRMLDEQGGGKIELLGASEGLTLTI